MSGHRAFSEIRRGPPGSWNRVGGDNRLHYFTDMTQAQWWRESVCGRGPAVGKGETDAHLGFCNECLPMDEELEATTGLSERVSTSVRSAGWGNFEHSVGRDGDGIVISFLLEEAFDRPGIEVEIRESTEEVAMAALERRLQAIGRPSN